MKACLLTSHSWSLPRGVLENVDALAGHLEFRDHETRVMEPDDPLDLRTRLLHPRLVRHGDVLKQVIPVGRSVRLNLNGSLASLAFSPVV